MHGITILKMCFPNQFRRVFYGYDHAGSGECSESLESENLPLQKLIEKAIFKFDLSPKDTEFLTNFFRESRSNK